MFADPTKIPLWPLVFGAVLLVHCGDDKSLVVGEERGGSDESGAGSAAAGASGSAGTSPSGGSGASASGGTGASPSGGAGASSGGGAGASSSGGAGASSGGGAGGASGAGGRPNGGDGPGPRPSCSQMADDYRDALRSAQRCMPGTPDPCTEEMPDDLLCGECPTYVNPTRYPDVTFMQQLIQLAAGCPRTCEQIECPPASAGVCMSEPNQNPPRPHCYRVP